MDQYGRCADGWEMAEVDRLLEMRRPVEQNRTEQNKNPKPGTGDALIKVQQDRKKLAEGHFNISATKRVSLKNPTDLERVAATELKSVEFSSETLFLVE